LGRIHGVGGHGPVPHVSRAAQVIKRIVRVVVRRSCVGASSSHVARHVRWGTEYNVRLIIMIRVLFIL